MNFISDRHALFVGWVLGIAVRNGVPASPVFDDDGNYTDRINIRIGDTAAERVTLTVVVPEPPDDWKLL